MGGTKRSFDEAEVGGSPAPGGRGGSFSARKRRDDGKGKHKAKEGSIEFSKKRARNIERLLNRNADLPANVRNDLERELAAQKATVTDKTFKKRRSAMISKYHMVRFFERKKASRLVKQLRRKIEKPDDDADVETLKRELHVAEVDEAYTLYHPHAEPYISLYGGSKADDEDDENDEDDGAGAGAGASSKASTAKAALKAERPPMWTVVEKAMTEGPDALTRLRERRSPDDAQAAAPRPARRPQRTPAGAATSSKRDAAAGGPSNQAGNIRQQGNNSNSNNNRQSAANGQRGGAKQAPQLNRRERRRLMRETMATKDDSDEDGGFFEEG